MPGYNTAPGALLNEDEIAMIVDYERNGLVSQSGNSLGVVPLGSGISKNNSIPGGSNSDKNNTNAGSQSNSKIKTGTNSNEGAGTLDKTGK